MSSNLTALITRLQTQLLDNGTLFSTPTCTAAFREALRKWNIYAPLHAGTVIDVISGAKEYALNDASIVNLLDVESIWLQDPAGGELDILLNYDLYFENNAPFIRLRDPLTTGHLVIRYTQPQTVSGLDNQTGGILTDDQEQVLIDGACVEAINIRLASLVEGFNLSPDVIGQYKRAEAAFVQSFSAGLQRYSARRSAVGEPSTNAWNDEWHDWLR